MRLRWVQEVGDVRSNGLQRFEVRPVAPTTLRRFRERSSGGVCTRVSCVVFPSTTTLELATEGTEITEKAQGVTFCVSSVTSVEEVAV